MGAISGAIPAARNAERVAGWRRLRLAALPCGHPGGSRFRRIDGLYRRHRAGGDHGRAYGPAGAGVLPGHDVSAGYRDSVYIAFHGSWNSTNLVGYKVMRVPLRDGKVAGPPRILPPAGYRTMASAGRPAGIVEAADGSLLISDNKGGFIYRISATGTR